MSAFDTPCRATYDIGQHHLSLEAGARQRAERRAELECCGKGTHGGQGLLGVFRCRSAHSMTVEFLAPVVVNSRLELEPQLWPECPICQSDDVELRVTFCDECGQEVK